MAVCPREDVHNFLCDVHAKLMLNEIDNLKIVEREDRKNQNCMLELGLRHHDVVEILKALTVSNYSKTVNDRKFPGTQLREFGYDYHGHELYIKLALRKKVICVSIHEKEYKITYPYLGV